jgi:ribokinase
MLFQQFPEANEKTEAIASHYGGGGPIATAIYTMAKLGDRVTFCGKVGDDPEGKLMREELAQVGVDISHIIISSGERSPQAQIWVEAGSGKRTVVLDKNTSSPLAIAEIPAELLNNCRYLLLDGRNTEMNLAAIKVAKKAGAKIVFDFGSMRQDIEPLLKQADIVIASEDFAQKFHPLHTPLETAKIIREIGAEIAIITLGEKGCVWVENAKEGITPAFQVEVMDTTGAGDVFHGAFIHGLLKGWDTEKSVEFAQAAAAISCTKLGGRGGVETEAQVLEFISV